MTLYDYYQRWFGEIHGNPAMHGFFREHFRMSLDSFQALCRILSPFMAKIINNAVKAFCAMGIAISCLSPMNISICSKCLKAFIVFVSFPVLADESLAFLYALSKLCPLSLHWVPVFNEEDASISSLALLTSSANCCHFCELPLPFNPLLYSLQRLSKISSSAVLQVFLLTSLGRAGCRWAIARFRTACRRVYLIVESRESRVKCRGSRVT